jgi:gas vesicle protein
MGLSKFLNFVGGLVSGAIVGAAVAMLLAPQSGTEVRRRVSGRFQEIMDAGKQAMTERRQQLRNEYEEAIRIPLPIDKPEAQ